LLLNKIITKNFVLKKIKNKLIKYLMILIINKINKMINENRYNKNAFNKNIANSIKNKIYQNNKI